MREDGKRQQYADHVERQQKRVQSPRYAVREFSVHSSNYHTGRNCLRPAAAFRGGPADQRKSVPYPAATPRTGRKRPAAGFLFFIYICLRSRATGIPSISRYLATVRRAIR